MREVKKHGVKITIKHERNPFTELHSPESQKYYYDYFVKIIERSSFKRRVKETNI